MITVNGLTVLSFKILIPWRGVWVANLKLDIDNPALLPSGKVTIILTDKTVLIGTVDPRSSGTFSSTSYIQVVGGGNGWDKAVPPQFFSKPDGNLTSNIIYNATSVLVNEQVLDPTPVNYGVAYTRSGGAASRVFGDRDYYVNPQTGITTVSSWPSTTLPSDSVLSNWEPLQERGEIFSNNLILPGTVLTDDRLNGVSYTVRDVEQSFDSTGNNAVVWCSTNPVTRLQEALACAVREFAGTAYMKSYLYRFVLNVSGGLALQAITVGAPDLNPIQQWAGLSGLAAKLKPSTEMVVGFVGGDPTQPYIISYSPLAVPLEVDIAGGANYLVPAPWAVSLSSALHTFAVSLHTVASFANVIAAGDVLKTALEALPTPTTVLTKAT